MVDGLKDPWDYGCLLAQFQEGMIFLIPKVQSVITNARQWRPITLFNIIYKIFSNILAKRVKPYFHDLIHVGQIRFMKNRCIIDNVLTLWEAIALVKKSNQ